MAELYMPSPTRPSITTTTSTTSPTTAWNSSTSPIRPKITTTTASPTTTHKPPRQKRRQQWRKLLWVEQDYPDNWVDPTFLKDLQRNINVHPYDFYSLVAESTVVVQHLSAMVIFVTSFMAIYDERISPVSVVGVSSVLTIAGWGVWEMGWGRREAARERAAAISADGGAPTPAQGSGLGIEMTAAQGSYFPPYNNKTAAAPPPPPVEQDGSGATRTDDHSGSLRRARVFTTAKSALLIYFTLLGLSPILRSLTKSISSDSIWAIASWLFIANLLGFDYGSGIERKFPAPSSTNVAITAAVVLASRLPSTTHVFSLMLFSIQVFGLFPVFRRYVKHLSWGLHVGLTVALVVTAAGGLGYALGWGWAGAYVFAVVAGMGGAGWWMIDLQKYKNEIHGPWDPAKPVLRRQWE